MTSTVPDGPVLVSVAEAAAQLDVSTRTLRYYEQLGFLTPRRTAGGHRQFSPDDIETVERIRRMQAVGLSLATIRKALRYRSYQDESGRHKMASADLYRIAAEARTDAGAVRDRIAALERELEHAKREADQLDRDVVFLETRAAERAAEE
jgi:DNA-binding transcriptional MerR regulator